MKTRLVAAAFAALALFPVVAPAQTDTRNAWDEAQIEYETGHYREAVSWLNIAAENNDVRAQQMLGMMHLYGESLYGPAVPRDVGLAKAWLYRAEAQGSSLAHYALGKLDKGEPVSPTLALSNRQSSGE